MTMIEITTPTTKTILDPYTQCEIIFFYNPRLKKFVVMMRDVATKRFIRMVRELYICGVVAFDTRTPEGHWAYPLVKREKDRSKNIWIECTQRRKLTQDDWKDLKRKEEFKELISKTATETIRRCQTCFDIFEKAYAIPIHIPRLEAYIVSTQPCETYCCYARPLHERAIALEEMDVKCFDKERCEYEQEISIKPTIVETSRRILEKLKENIKKTKLKAPVEITLKCLDPPQCTKIKEIRIVTKDYESYNTIRGIIDIFLAGEEMTYYTSITIYCPELLPPPAELEKLPITIETIQEYWRLLMTKAWGTHLLREVATEVIYDDTPEYE